MADNAEAELAEALALAARVGLKGFTPTDSDGKAIPQPAAEHADPELAEVLALAARVGLKGFTDGNEADA